MHLFNEKFIDHSIVANFLTATVREDNADRPVASRYWVEDWVKDNIKGGELNGYFNSLSIKSGNDALPVATKKWVTSNFAKPSDIPSLSGYAKTSEVTYIRDDTNKSYHYSTLDVHWRYLSEIQSDPSNIMILTSKI